MIDAVTKTLRNVLLSGTYPTGVTTLEVGFDRPGDSFSHTTDALGAYLYDVREDIEKRNNEPIVEATATGVTIQPAPLRVACTYLVTAWPDPGLSGENAAFREHALLGYALHILSRHPTIPDSLRDPSLKQQEPPLPLVTAQPNGLPDPAEFWTSLDGKLRPSLTATVTAAMAVFDAVTAPEVLTEEIRLGQRTAPDEESIVAETRADFYRIGGRITDASDAPVADATVRLVGVTDSTQTDADGRYTLGMVPAGTHRLRAETDAADKEVNVTVPAPAGQDYDLKLS